MRTSEPVWHPSLSWRDDTLIGEIVTRLGLSDYDSLLALSLSDPPRYWAAVMSHLGFPLRTPYTEFCHTEHGPEFPRWMPGASLNWVDGMVRHAKGSQANHPAVIAEDEKGEVTVATYGELHAEVLKLAGGLARLGIGRGTRVGLMMSMALPAVTTVLALSALGAIAVPLFTGFGVDAAVSRLNLSGSTYLVASASMQRRGKVTTLEATLTEICARCPDLGLIVDGPTAAPGACEWRRLQASAPLAEPRAMSASDPFMIVYTSGTTGQPKGTVHTHGGFPLKILHDSAYHFELRPGDRWLWPSDMGWIVGPITTVGALSRGATLVCYDGAPDHPDTGRLAALIDRHRITHFGASPTLLRSLAAAGGATEGARLDSLRLLITAGEVIDPEHFMWFFREFGGHSLPIINYTGGTEASGALLANVPVRPIKPCAFNSISPGVDAYVADAQGSRLSIGTGELVIGAPFVGMTDGFWGAADRYLESYWTERPGVWSHGDLVARGDDGQFTVLGRADDTLKIAGKRVGPAEVEAILLELPQVRAVAALGLPDPIKGEQLVICMVAEGASAALDELISGRIQAALGKPFRPSRIYHLGQLPRTRNGKIMRRVIRNVLRGLDPGDLSALDNPDAIPPLRNMHGGA